MLPNPLHPALVHFPMVFVVLLPIAAVVALWTIRRGAAPTRAWLVPTALAVGLALSAWIAVETGEQQEDVVERVVAEQTIETHGELAERFLLLSVGMAGLAGVGLLKNRVGAAARPLGLFAAIGLMFVGYQVGHTGGELVYRHGAAAAYVDAASGSVARTDTRAGAMDDDGDEREGR